MEALINEEAAAMAEETFDCALHENCRMHIYRFSTGFERLTCDHHATDSELRAALNGARAHPADDGDHNDVGRPPTPDAAITDAEIIIDTGIAADVAGSHNAVAAALTPPITAEGGVGSSQTPTPMPDSSIPRENIGRDDSGGAEHDDNERAAATNGKVAHPRSFPNVKFALSYARKGIKVFPEHEIESDGECSCGKLDCQSAGKHPRLKDWQRLATIDEDQIMEWWREWPTANIGLKCGVDCNLTVLDVDGDEGRDTLRSLELENGELPMTPIAITGSGGAHYYFAFEDGLQNEVRFAPGLDIRTEGGLVVGVGSRNKRGPYMWEAAFTLGEVQPAKMPRWLVEKIKGAEKSKGDRIIVPSNVSEMGEGSGRNDLIYRLGRSLKAQNYPPDAIKASLTALNSGFKIPLGKELATVIGQVLTQPDRPQFLTDHQRNNGARPLADIVTAGDYLRYCEGLTSGKVFTEGVLYAGQTPMIVGRGWSGKTTLCCSWVRALIEGGNFLGRACTPCKVGYLALERNGAVVAALFQKWGIEERVVFATSLHLVGIPIEKRPGWLGELVQKHSLEIVFVDHLQDLTRIKNMNDQAEVENAIGPYNELVQKTAICLPILHHQGKTPKFSKDYIDVQGSEGYRASVDTLLECYKSFGSYYVRGQVRGEKDFERVKLSKTPDGRVEAAGDQGDVGLDNLILETLTVLDRWATTKNLTEISPELGQGSPRSLHQRLKVLHDERRIARKGEGVAYHPFYFASLEVAKRVPSEPKKGKTGRLL